MRYHFKIHKEGTGFWAECLEIPGCVTQGDSKEELRENMEDAINTILQEPPESKYLYPLPDKKIKKGRNIVEVPVDPGIAFGFSLRYNRIKIGKTQEQIAEELGMDKVYSYQRLEKKCNPTLSLIEKLLRVYPKLSVDRVLK